MWLKDSLFAAETGGADSKTPLPRTPSGLLLPGAFLMAMGAQLLAPFMLIDFGFPSFL
jgi:hypothetical protein